MNPDKIEHIHIIQNVIERMASNSRSMKGWCLAVLSAIIGFAANSGNSKLLWMGAISIVSFWIIDACYLATERRFVSLYNEVIKPESTIPLFYLGSKKDNDRKHVGNKIKSIIASIFASWSTIPFYLPLVLGISLMAWGNWLKREDQGDTTIKCGNVVIEKLTVPESCCLPPPPSHHHHHPKSR